MFEIKIEKLIDYFEEKYNKSQDKETLLKQEIEAHELLFDEKKLPLRSNVFSNNRPIKYINVYTDSDIVHIREAYQRYIVRGVDINKDGDFYYINKKDLAKIKKDKKYLFFENSKGRAYRKLPPDDLQIHYYNEAKQRFEYLNWLKGLQGSKKTDESKTAIYAYYYHILHTVEPKTRFENDPKGKMAAIKKIAEDKGISLKGFQLRYNELENKAETRISPKKTHILQSVIKLLTDYPDGLKLANEYLEKSKE